MTENPPLLAVLAIVIVTGAAGYSVSAFADAPPPETGATHDQAPDDDADVPDPCAEALNQTQCLDDLLASSL